MVERDWKGFLLKAVQSFREGFDGLRDNQRDVFERHGDAVGGLAAFTKPCQIVLIEFVEPLPLALIVTHKRDVPDLSFQVYEKIDSVEHLVPIFSQERPPSWLDSDSISKLMRRIATAAHAGYIESYSYLHRQECALLIFKQSAARRNPEYIAHSVFSSIWSSIREFISNKEKMKIGNSAVALSRDAIQITDLSLRNKIVQSSNQIQQALQQIRRLDEHEKKLDSMQTEIMGVHRLMGASKEYQDFVLLTSTVDEIKKEHVRMGLFDETIKRIDEKIDGLGKRIDDLRETRLWSKRTAIDVTLAVIATASTIIAALLAAGYLHF